MNIYNILNYAKGISGLASAAAFVRRTCLESVFPFGHGTRIIETIDERTHLRLRVFNAKTGVQEEWKASFKLEKVREP